MSHQPFLDELLRRLRMTDPEATETGDGVTWNDAEAGPVVLVTSEQELARTISETDEDTRDALWPDSTVEETGFNLLLVHIDEVLATRVHGGSLRITADGLVWPEQTSLKLPDLQPGDGPFYWTTDTGERFPEEDH